MRQIQCYCLTEMRSLLAPDPRLADETSTEARVRDATLACVARWGLGKTTLDDIARESGVSRATIYRVFPGGKDALFDAVLAAEISRFFHTLDDVVADAADLEELLVAGVGGSMRFLLDHAALAAVLALEPELVLPQFAFHRLDPVLAMASRFAAPHLERHLPPGRGLDSRRAAEYLVRVVLSYCLHPSDHVDPHDPASVRLLVRNHLVPALTSEPSSP